VRALPEAVDRADNPDDDLSMVSVTSTPLSSLRHGDRVRVAVGQAFPADGQILLGETEVDESLLTGESRALPRRAGQTVVAGSMNMGSPVWMAIERLGPDTRYQQIVSLVHQAMTEKPGWMRFADRMAAPFLWGVIVLAAGGALVWQWIDPSKSIWVAVSVLVVTCPCALSLSAPSALLAAAGAMARKGLLVRRLDALEALSAIDEVYFDKTGTLTEGELSVVAIVTPEGRVPTPHGLPVAQVDCWGVAAALASYSQHPLSRSLVKAAQDAGGWPATSWIDVREQAGKGVQATDAQGRVWRLGQLSWVLTDVVPQPGEVAGWWTQHDDARVWMAAIGADGRLHPDTVAGFVFDEVFRAEARPTVQRLRELGCHSSLLSGDQSARVHAAARHLGQGDAMTVAQAQATPEDKLNVIARMQAQGHRVAVVGDGINDAPVLAKADVSIALDQGAALAQSQADLIILGGRLLGLPEAVVISRQAMRIVRQNLAWSALYNASCIPLALMGFLPPWLAGLGMALSSLGVVLNALRLGPGRH
jgi:Cu2+-exporting ATPase